MADGRLTVRGTLFIRESDLAERFVATGGPGGQAVNKLATGVQLRYAPRVAQTLPWPVIVKAEQLAGSRLNSEGEIVISATRHRSQDRNRADARERLLELLREASAPPPKKRRPTRPSLSAKRKRTDTKVQRGATKRLRGKPSMD
ncbi:alternative ribosome rescue aminoacyl-tRNA hydrolase ArfB [Rhizobiaceae bacterium]|nr:alternative ribosome rescue aminoacyl-tRNA hydrolase ArfB [Rhizobiaceae bacterium]